MISAGDGILTGTRRWPFVASCRGRREQGWGSGAGRPVGVTAASWCGPVSGVTCARPPAVAVFGLRRSGRTGNGEGPSGRIARLPAWPLSSLPIPVRGGASGLPSPPGARRAPRALDASEETPHPTARLSVCCPA